MIANTVRAITPPNPPLTTRGGQPIVNNYYTSGGTQGVADALGRTSNTLQTNIDNLSSTVNNLLISPSISGGTFSGTNYFTGNVGIGTTTPWKALSVNGGVAMPALANDSTGYYACVNTTTGQLATSTTVCGASSIKYKENIQPLSYGLNDVLKLNPVFFNYKSSYTPEQRKQVGFIAEEVASVTPEVVAYASDGTIQGLDYPKFTAILAKAIQELNTKLDLLTTTIGQGTNALKNLVLDSVTSTTIYTREITADKINVNGDICVNNTCITKDQFEQMILRSGVGATQHSAPEVAGASAQVSESTSTDVTSTSTPLSTSTTTPEIATSTPSLEKQDTASTTGN